MKVLISSISILFLALSAWTQDSSIQQHELELERLLNELRASTDDAERAKINRDFKAEWEKTLQLKESFSYPFSKLKTVGVIDSPDGNLRIVNWNVEQSDLSHQYFCYVLFPQKRSDVHNFVELKDVSFGMPTQPDGILTADQWYGALYYKIIPIDKGSRTVYTVLAWDYYSQMSQLKLIDVMYVSGNSIKLGSPVFKIGKETKNRVFFEHSKKATMYLNYEADRKRIMMDHLSPESASMKNFREFYVPDLSYDALNMDGSRWVLEEDVIGVNPESDPKKRIVYVKNEKTGKLEAKEIKSNWQNPEDLDAPAGGSEHVAVTPEGTTPDGKTKKEKEPKQKKDKRDPSELSIFKDLKKSKKKRN